MQWRENHPRSATKFSHPKNVADFHLNRAKQTIFYYFLYDKRGTQVIALSFGFVLALTISIEN